MKLLDGSVTSSLHRVQEGQQKITMKHAPPWTWVTGSVFPLWSLLGSCSGLFHLWIQRSSMCPLWKPADCPLQGTTIQVLSFSPSSALNSRTEAMKVKRFTDTSSSWDSKACWRKCWGMTGSWHGTFRCVLKSTGGRQHLCRKTPWLLHTTYT